ncbi:PKD domain-containing protein [Actinomadura sp. WMMB 499]|uniref:PKD domain-containing protein n=1 Tax=Actinomadura sp. WMMB 499 TaxID=1219491 RepID=UPI001247B692|nr:PKD domain-containing protein [Actinomadura sp. WMMB 499]QFG21401.1 hypothetical protein F7P10_09900 [Actinomadura sp. WMMB 499]
MSKNVISNGRAHPRAGHRSSRRRLRSGAVATTLLGVAGLLPALHAPAAAAPPACAPPSDGAPLFVTDGCADPRFDQPYVDVDEWRDTPVRHRYVHGGFRGTDAKFSFAFPAPEEYQGRFFHFVNAIPGTENVSALNIGFGMDSGAYYVQTNGGGNEAIRTVEDAVVLGKDPSVAGYRVDAAAAKYSRVLAAEMYGRHRPYGYVYGGSGGSFKTISAVENSRDVWDGSVPFVIGTPQYIPNAFTPRVHALRVLSRRDRLPGIVDAIEPGGSGDMYAGLNEEERGALEEVTRMGFPPRGWFAHENLDGGALSLVFNYVPYLDPTYVEDFWTRPGYLGTDPASSVREARVRHETTVAEVSPATFTLRLADLPAGDLTGVDLVLTGGAAAGKTLRPSSVEGGVARFAFGADPEVFAAVRAGDGVRVDNSWYLAAQTYHRHQVPGRDYDVWDQFRDRRGRPLYPQRDVLVGPKATYYGAGSLQTGRFDGKMIAISNLMDIDALPWAGDWYRDKVRKARGAGFGGDFRLWYFDRAGHLPTVSPAESGHLVGYYGVLQQALRDLSAWVEKDRPAPASTEYDVVDGQVKVPAHAWWRRGIQPTIDLRADGGDRAEVKAGQPVTLSADVALPRGTGEVVAAEWDFEDAGAFPVRGEIDGRGLVRQVEAEHAYTEPGTYFAVLRVTAQRDGDAETPYGRVQNLARVRIVVR